MATALPQHSADHQATMVPSSSLQAFFLCLIFPIFLPASSPIPFASPPPDGPVGVTYSMKTPGIPPPEQVADALVAVGVPSVLLLDPYPAGINAFNNTSISLRIAINNTNLPQLAANESEAMRWIGDNIILADVTLQSVAVGYDVLSSHLDIADYLLPALKNLHLSFTQLGIEKQVTVSTCNAFDLITPAFPPSAARFNESVAATYVEPLLAFLAATNSSFLIDAFPFKLYRSGLVGGATTGLATFEPGDGNHVTDPKTGLVYDNLFDAMVDAVVGAMTHMGYQGVPVVVSRTGWPSDGGVHEPEASLLFAGEYNERLVSRLNAGMGTPARPGVTPQTYIYSLFDEPWMSGAESERNWGIWTNTLDPKYVINFKESAANRRATPAVGLLLFLLLLHWVFYSRIR